MVNIGEKILKLSLCSLLNFLFIVKIELYSNFFFGGDKCMREGERDRNEGKSSNKK